jgi:2-polyprenyl-3-methyl-5-hydroxy-6-metoxy-1,4-benzoquinol methylase/uncharacterized Rossmann fold enzyme
MTPAVLNLEEKQNVQYAVPIWLRDEQIKLAITRVKGRIEQRVRERRPDPVAVVCFGPSLNDTWEKIREFKYVFSCSGSHKFLVERGITPTYHLEVDPRAHKVKLIGPPQKETEYLIASTCHPAVFDHLEGFNVKLWHIFDSTEEGLRVLPPGEWSITGGCSVGLRAMAMARFLGFVDIHIFGMDGNFGKSGKHAAEHPNQPQKHFLVEYDGVTYETTPAVVEAAKQTFHEMNQLPNTKIQFYGEGLVQHMARKHKPEYNMENMIAFIKPELISAEYRDLNARLHVDNLAYGIGGGRFADRVIKLVASLKTTDNLTPSVLDYGCGKSYLAKALPFPIWEYDPAIAGKSESPRPADLVVCTDVLEHVEPDKLKYVLRDLMRCVKQIGFFVIHTGPAQKVLADGRNAHLIQQDAQWWGNKLLPFFSLGKIIKAGSELHIVVSPKTESRTGTKLLAETAT